jgi:hypothetical protein
LPDPARRHGRLRAALLRCRGQRHVVAGDLLPPEQRSRGATPAYIEREIKERYQKGEFQAPRRVGICYMLSTRNAVVESGKVARVGPRLVFYAPISATRISAPRRISSRA